MILTASLICSLERIPLATNSNLAVFMFLFMICAMEVVVLRVTTMPPSLFERTRDLDYDDSSEYEEDIYYEELLNEDGRRHGRRHSHSHRQQEQLREEQMLLQHHAHHQPFQWRNIYHFAH